jgi:hypothetical protein
MGQNLRKSKIGIRSNVVTLPVDDMAAQEETEDVESAPLLTPETRSTPESIEWVTNACVSNSDPNLMLLTLHLTGQRRSVMQQTHQSHQ